MLRFKDIDPMHVSLVDWGMVEVRVWLMNNY